MNISIVCFLRSLAANNNILYRLDISQSHVAIGNVMLSNLMSLMTCRNERWALLRTSHMMSHDHPIEVTD